MTFFTLTNKDFQGRCVFILMKSYFALVFFFWFNIWNYEYCNVNNEVLLEYEVVNIDIRSYFWNRAL